MNKIRITSFLCVMSLVFVLPAQSTRYGLKFGPSVGFQRWNYYQNDPLLKYHGNFWMESYQDDEP